MSPGFGIKKSDGLEAALAQLDEKVTSIVVIDDNPHDSRLIRRLMQRYKQYRIFEAHNGPDGIDLVKQRRPELVLLDLTIPGMDGFAILEELKNDKRTSDIPVMIISGKELTSDQHAFLNSKAESILQKGSFSGKELINNVAEMIGDSLEPIDIRIPDTPQRNDEDKKITEFGDDERPKILVVDDNIWDSRLMRRLFESKQRFDVIEVNNGSQAWEVIQKRVPDLIILDLLLPDEQGEEILSRLRSNNSTETTPVIIVSGKDIEPDSRAGLSRYADSIWSKTMLDRSSLLTHVEEILTD